MSTKCSKAHRDRQFLLIVSEERYFVGISNVPGHNSKARGTPLALVHWDLASLEQLRCALQHRQGSF